jgi:hypothetical protein
MPVKVIIVPDSDAEARDVPPGILAMLGPNTVLMSNDSLRMYVRATQWKDYQSSFDLFTVEDKRGG